MDCLVYKDLPKIKLDMEKNMRRDRRELINSTNMLLYEFLFATPLKFQAKLVNFFRASAHRIISQMLILLI